MKIIYPGTFDPITYGHIDLIKRASKVFKQVIVAVAESPNKETLFSFSERISLVKGSLRDISNVEVEGFAGLVVEFAKQRKSRLILRGLRMVSDFEYEFQMALTNRKIEKEVETVFLMPHPDFSYLSSRLIKEAFFLEADISPFVPPLVRKALESKKTKI